MQKGPVDLHSLGPVVRAANMSANDQSIEVSVHAHEIDEPANDCVSELVSAHQSTCISSLPTELWRDIFLRTLRHDTSTQQKSTSITLSHVCRNWRDITLNDPLLWTHIYLPCHPDRTSTFLERSTDVALNITASDPHDLYDRREVIKQVTLCLRIAFARIRSLHLHIRSSTYVAVSRNLPSSVPAPVLNSLSIRLSDDSWTLFPQGSPTLLIRADAPSISSLTFDSRIPELSSLPPLSHLVSLTIFPGPYRGTTGTALMDLTHVLKMLRPLLLLEYLSIPSYYFKALADLPVCEKVELPSLRELSLFGNVVQSASLLRYLVFPSTVDLTLTSIYARNLGTPPDYIWALDYIVDLAFGASRNAERGSLHRLLLQYGVGSSSLLRLHGQFVRATGTTSVTVDLPGCDDGTAQTSIASLVPLQDVRHFAFQYYKDIFYLQPPFSSIFSRLRNVEQLELAGGILDQIASCLHGSDRSPTACEHEDSTTLAADPLFPALRRIHLYKSPPFRWQDQLEPPLDVLAHALRKRKERGYIIEELVVDETYLHTGGDLAALQNVVGGVKVERSPSVPWYSHALQLDTDSDWV